MSDTSAKTLARDRVLDPSCTAILVVDAQMAEYCDDKRAAHRVYVDAIEHRALPAIRKLVDAARRLRIEVVYTVIESLTRDGRDRSLDHKLSGIHVPKGSPLARMMPGIEPAEDDIVLRKTSSGVFNSTNAEYVLRNLGIQNVVVAGFLTDQCVDMAVRDGADKGFYMVCAADACATYTDERHAGALRAFGGYCRVQTVDEILATIG